MDAIVKNDYQSVLNEQKKEVRNLVMEGLEQIKDGKAKTVFDCLSEDNKSRINIIIKRSGIESKRRLE